MKVMTIFGTRPEGIKMAPVIKGLLNDSDFECVVVNTAQHREQLDQVLDSFEIKADYDLNIMKLKQNPLGLTSTILTKLDPIIKQEKPDLVLVHGDTTTTFSGAYAAFLNKIPVGHVEAGLRTNTMYDPFPEEKNRELVSHISTFHFAVTERNIDNLLRENIQKESICLAGNTVLDSLSEVVDEEFDFPDDIKSILNSNFKTVLLTSHRRETVEQLDGLKGIFDSINRLVQTHDDIQILFPVHKNPEIRSQVRKYLNENPRIHLIEPLSYEIFANVMNKCHLIITDSGGIQEEAPMLNVPVLVARNTTERQEGIEAGTLELVGTDGENIYNAADLLLSNKDKYQKMKNAVNPYGDGKATEKIISFIKSNCIS